MIARRVRSVSPPVHTSWFGGRMLLVALSTSSRGVYFNQVKISEDPRGSCTLKSLRFVSLICVYQLKSAKYYIGVYWQEKIQNIRLWRLWGRTRGRRVRSRLARDPHAQPLIVMSSSHVPGTRRDLITSRQFEMRLLTCHHKLYERL